jgi:hypothetical protein
LTLTELSLPEQQLDEGSIELVETLHEKASAKFGDDDDDNNDYSYSELKESSYLSRVFTSYEDIKNHSFALTDIVYTPLFLHAKILGIFQEEDSKS